MYGWSVFHIARWSDRGVMLFPTMVQDLLLYQRHF